MLSFSLLGADDAPAYAELAFPQHRANLVHLGSTGTMVGVGANVLGQPWGLALAELTGASEALLLSVAVVERARRRGLATELLAELEAALRGRGVERVLARYRPDRAHSEAVSRLLDRRGFERPAERTLVELRYRIARVLEAPVLNVPCPGAEVVAFSPERFEPLRRLFERSDTHDPSLAVLLTLDGDVAGCVLGVRLDAETGHILFLYVRDEHRRRGLAAFAVRCFLLRLLEQGLVNVSCEVRLDNHAWLPVADGKLAPYAFSRSIFRVARKSL